MANSVQKSGGIGISGALTILFVLLKVFGKIDWSWWWVFSPLWISAGVTLLILALVLGVAILAAVFE